MVYWHEVYTLKSSKDISTVNSKANFIKTYISIIGMNDFV